MERKETHDNKPVVPDTCEDGISPEDALIDWGILEFEEPEENKEARKRQIVLINQQKVKQYRRNRQS